MNFYASDIFCRVSMTSGSHPINRIDELLLWNVASLLPAITPAT
jgi:hypothetical protein